MKNLTWQNPEQLFVAQELINKVKSKCCGIKDYHTIYKNDYDLFPLDEEKYIGFRFTDADRFRYGWMKIKLYNNEGNYFVKLLETAIQE